MKYTKSKYTSDISDVDNMDGLEFEAFCCELLRCNGYTNVIKTQASGDYGLDVIATSKDGFVCGMQCKNYQGSVGISAVQEAKSGSNYYNCDVAVVLTNSTFTKAAVELAQKTNVKLWDRSKLEELIKVFPEKKIVQEQTTANDTGDYIKKYNSDDILAADNMTTAEFRALCCEFLAKKGFTIIHKKYDKKTSYVVAEKNDIKYAILLERNFVGEDCVKKMEQIRNANGHARAVILTIKYFTTTAKNRAEKNNISMWDRDMLINFLTGNKGNVTGGVNNSSSRNNKTIYDIEREKNIQQINNSDGNGCAYGCLIAVIIIILLFLKMCS